MFEVIDEGIKSYIAANRDRDAFNTRLREYLGEERRAGREQTETEAYLRLNLKFAIDVRDCIALEMANGRTCEVRDAISHVETAWAETATSAATPSLEAQMASDTFKGKEQLATKEIEAHMRSGLRRFMVGMAGVVSSRSVGAANFAAEFMPRNFGSGLVATWARLYEIAKSEGLTVERDLGRNRVLVRRATVEPSTPAQKATDPVKITPAAARNPAVPVPLVISETTEAAEHSRTPQELGSTATREIVAAPVPPLNSEAVPPATSATETAVRQVQAGQERQLSADDEFASATTDDLLRAIYNIQDAEREAGRQCSVSEAAARVRNPRNADDPEVVARKAQDYQLRELASGRTCSFSQAVHAVVNPRPDNDPSEVARRAQDYQVAKASSGIRVTSAEAVAFVTRRERR